MIKPRYNIGQQVYHATPESPTGIVLDCIYSVRKNEWEYLVSFGANEESLVYYEEEVSETKVFK